MQHIPTTSGNGWCFMRSGAIMRNKRLPLIASIPSCHSPFINTRPTIETCFLLFGKHGRWDTINNCFFLSLQTPAKNTREKNHSDKKEEWQKTKWVVLFVINWFQWPISFTSIGAVRFFFFFVFVSFIAICGKRNRFNRTICSFTLSATANYLHQSNFIGNEYIRRPTIHKK